MPQSLAEELSGFRVASPEEDICSNRLVYMDLVLLMQYAMVHAVERDTLFSAASARDGYSVAQMWGAFMHTLVTPLVGLR